MKARPSILGIITMILLLIVILGMGIDSVSNRKTTSYHDTYPENTTRVLEFDYNYHIQPGSLPY